MCQGLLLEPWLVPHYQQMTESEQLRECIAELLAEGSVRSHHSAERFQFPRSGYLKPQSRIQALRGLKAQTRHNRAT